MPKLIGIGVIFWPGGFLAAHLHGRVALEIERLLQQLLDLCHPLINAFLVEIVNLVGRFEVAEQDVVAQRGAVFSRQRIDVLLGKEKVTEIEQLEVVTEKFL